MQNGGELIIGGRDPLPPAASLFLGWFLGWFLGSGEKMYRIKILNFIDYVSDS